MKRFLTKSLIDPTYTKSILNKRNSIIITALIKKQTMSNLTSTQKKPFTEAFPQAFNFTNSSEQNFKENRIIIYTRKLNFEKSGTLLLYKSEIEQQNLYKSLLLKKDLLASLTFIITTGFILNLKLSLLFFVPFYFKFKKQINFNTILGFMSILFWHRVITEIHIDKSLKKVIIKVKDNQFVVKKTTDICLLTKDQSRIVFPVYDNSNTDIYRLFAYEFLPIKVDGDYMFLLPIDGRIFNKELLGHVLRGRAIMKPQVPEFSSVAIADKNEDLNGNVYVTNEFERN